MDVDTARKQVVELVEEIQELRTLAVESAKRSLALRKVVGGLVEAYPELAQLIEPILHLGQSEAAPPSAEAAPRGAEAVLMVLQDQPGYRFFVSELVSALKERGWLPESDNPANAVRTAVERLVASEETDVVKGRMSHEGTMKVTYTYDPDRERPSPPSGGYGFDEEPF